MTGLGFYFQLQTQPRNGKQRCELSLSPQVPLPGTSLTGLSWHVMGLCGPCHDAVGTWMHTMDVRVRAMGVQGAQYGYAACVQLSQGYLQQFRSHSETRCLRQWTD